jgi:hypothetical protein
MGKRGAVMCPPGLRETRLLRGRLPAAPCGRNPCGRGAPPGPASPLPAGNRLPLQRCPVAVPARTGRTILDAPGILSPRTDHSQGRSSLRPPRR